MTICFPKNLVRVAVALLAFLPIFSRATDPKAMECTFETGAKAWSGDGTIVADETGSNKVYSLKKTGAKPPEIAHTITVPKNSHVEIRFRARGMPGGKDMRLIKATRGKKGVGLAANRIEANGEWVDRMVRVQDKNGTGPFERTVALILKEGMGELQIDDIQVTIQSITPTDDGSTPLTKAEPAPEPASQPKTIQTSKEDYWQIGEEAAILIPAGWEVVSEGLPAPVLFSAESDQLAISAIKESPEAVAIRSLDEYAQIKATNLSGSFPDFQPSEPKSGKIGGLPAVFFQGPASVGGVKVAVNAVAIQGKEHFYLLLGLLAQEGPPAEKNELMRLLGSFREREK